jgi:hypothetical protein
MNYKKVLEDIKKLGEFMPEMENEEIDYSMLFQEYGVDVKSLVPKWS